jgi:hypothetical protein
VDSKGEVLIANPFRRDPHPSLWINLEDGRFNDFGSDFKGDAYNFYMRMQDASYTVAKKAVDEIVGKAEEGLEEVKMPMPVSNDDVKFWHEALLRNVDLKRYMTDKRGISLDVLKKHKIGFDGTRYTIPVYNSYDVCVNVRRYSPTSSGADKMNNYKSGYGNARLYPISELSNKIIFLHEGEWDTLVQLSHGFHAVTNTAGANTWLSDWNELFAGKVVYIVYDNDSQHKNNKGEFENIGQNAARKVATNLLGVAEKVFIVVLPLSGTPDDKDISDFYKGDRTTEDFMNVVAATPEFTTAQADTKVTALQAKHVSLVEARKARYKGKAVEFDVTVVGKDTAPFNIPMELEFKCSMVGLNERLCGSCQVGRCGGTLDLSIAKDPDMLDFIRASKQQQMGLIKKKAGVPQNCSMYQCEDKDSVNIEEILLAPEIQAFSEWTGESEHYLLQSAFFVDKTIDANRSYRMRGTMTPDPWQQHVTFLLTECEPLQDTVSAFKVTPEVIGQLKAFQTDDVRKKMDEIHNDFEQNVTFIHGRSDLLEGIDLVYHSVLGFTFQGVPVQKGWCEMLCLGDTRTGKSETVIQLLRHYQLGEMSVAENTSYAGLVGGLQQTGDKRWFLTWGKLPLNDGRLFVIDEASGLSTDDIAKMSGIRSSGIAEVTKIHTERTTARTRLIWLSNPRSGRHLGSYSYGVQAVSELIGKAEDISRFDYVVSAARTEVSIEEINRRLSEDENVEHKYNSELCKLLILWAWSRKPEHVVFDSDATHEILKNAIKMGKEYSSQIPLVEGANQRIKIAKIAVAAAARVFSTDETCEKVVVKKEHVEYAVDFLERIYGKPSLDYRGYSRREVEDRECAEQNRETVLKYLSGFAAVADLFDRQEYVWPKHLEEQLGIPREAVQEHIAFFTSNRMIYDANNRGYRKTPAFIQLLREWKYQQAQEGGK